jgi:hypothetical protein
LDTVCDFEPVRVPTKGVNVIFGLPEPKADADVVLDELNEPVPELVAVVVLVVLIEAVPVGQWVAVFDPEEDPVLVGEKVIMLLHDAEPVCIGDLEMDTVLVIDTVLLAVAFAALLFVLDAVEVLLTVVDSENVLLLVLLWVIRIEQVVVTEIGPDKVIRNELVFVALCVDVLLGKEDLLFVRLTAIDKEAPSEPVIVLEPPDVRL